MKFLYTLVAPIFIASLALHCGSYVAGAGTGTGAGEWRIITKQNFSSQIRLHPHMLLLVTLPWSGESRSLMKDVVHLVADRKEEFGSLKLTFMHRNTEKMLADSIGATTDEITVFYFHYSIPYKYRGRLQAKKILSSFYPYISVSPEEVPLKALKTPEELRVFLDSTDKALVLIDFCGWTPKLLAESKKNGTENGFSFHGDDLIGFSGESDTVLVSRAKNNLKVAGKDMCKAELTVSKGFTGVPWLGGFNLINDTGLEGTKDMDDVLSSCNFEEFQRFHSFYQKFMTVVREFFLPLERHRFGLVLERSMLSSLGVNDSGSWLAVSYLAGCPSCSKILKEDDLNYVLQMDDNFVKELEGRGHDQEPILQANKPSIILFVDRSSDSLEIREKSNEALDVFRELAQDYHVVNEIGRKVYQGLKSTSKHPKLKLSRTAQKIKLKEKMSTIMIVNEGKHVSLDKVASDLQVSSLHEILGYLLQQKKDGKLSSLAKDLGFQLLSDDIDIKSVNTQQSQSEVQVNEMPIETSQADRADVNQDHDPYWLSTSAGGLEENSKLTELSFQQDEVKTNYIDTGEEIRSEESEESVADHELPVANMKVKTESSSDGYKFGEEQSPVFGFNSSFFYSDGNYQLLQTLTGGCQIPSLVIVDPFQQQHYVFPEVKNLDSSSLNGFLSGFLNGSLHPYQRSKHILQGPREATHPPFINLDFHEVDSIPQITARTFSELVIGHNESDNENAFHAWNKDVLVLFSNSWCGFCQRMELVVREVYRVIKSYMDVLKSGSRSSKAIYDHENLDYVTMKVPMIYLLDCTLNDCDLILKSVNQREVYPGLILFPALKKKPLLYEGDMTVVDVIKFVAEHGNNLHHLFTEKAVLRLSNRGGRNQNLYKYTLQIDDHEESLHANKKSHGTQCQDSELDRVVRSSQIKSPPPPNELHETLPPVKVGSVLIATRNLLGLQPFDGSKILIVAVDQITGIQGLITNKHMAWNSLGELQEGLDILKRAPLSFGGPVMQSGMPLVALARSASRNSLPEILPGVYFLDQLATVHKIEELKSANESVADHWFFLGYSSWGWNQLFGEVARGDWNLGEDGMEHLTWP